MASGSIKIELQESGRTDALLALLPIEMREKALTAALRASLKPVVSRAKALCPKGGPRIKTKAGKKHLRDTITSAVRNYGQVKVGLVGPAYPAGAHGHLVEFGHDVVRDGKVVGRAEPKPFLRPAAEQTKSEQQTAFIGELQNQVASIGAA